MCHQYKKNPKDLSQYEFGVPVLPTRAIVCRILLLLLTRSQSLRWTMIYLYRWRAEGRFAGRAWRFRTPCCVWRGTWTGFDGWIRGVSCEKCWYSCSIWWGHVQLNPAEFNHRWQQRSGRKRQQKRNKVLNDFYLFLDWLCVCLWQLFCAFSLQ